jgi:glycine/D-amino acid oxidase-like deaminating enzyme
MPGRVIIVGAGIVGASCAYHATSLGAQVVLVDAGIPGQATAAGAGIVCPWSSAVSDPAWYAFASTAASQYPRLVEDLAEHGQADVGYRRVGALYLAPTQDRRDEELRRLLARRAQAPQMGDVQAVSGGEAQRMFPPLSAGRWAVYIGGAGRVDGRLLRDALVAAAVASGASTRAGRAELACRSGRAIGVVLDGQLIEGDAVVAATGAWTSAFAAHAGLAVAVSPQRGQIVHMSLTPADTSRWPVVLPGGSGHYLLAFGDSRVVAGATRESSAGFDYRVTPGGLAEVLAEALAVAPGLASGTYLETRVGFRPAGPDARPLLGPVASVPGLVIATGLGANGLTTGPYAGAIAARVAIGEPPDVDLTPFDPLRPPPAPGTGQ